MRIEIVENDSLNLQGRTYAEYRLFAALSQAAEAGHVARASLVMRPSASRGPGNVVCTVSVESTDGHVTRFRAAGHHPYAAINRAVERIRRIRTMWHRVFASRVMDDHHERFVIAPHHPDRLQRPPAGRAPATADRVAQALTWNVFRTLELVSPSFWLRRFHVRLTGEPSLVPCQIARVHLWRRLPLPPIQRIDGERPDVIADVVIETEHAVWTLAAPSEPERAEGVQPAALADAGAWFAGARRHYCGVIESPGAGTSLGLSLRERYSR